MIVSALTAFAFEASAQWVTQSFEVEAGWNAIYFEIEPFPPQCEHHFNNPAVISVWAFNDRFSPVTFIDDPNDLTPDTPNWSFHAPPHREAFAASTLFALESHRAYLVHAEENATLNIRGRAVLRDRDWAPDSLNFRGLHVDPMVPPTFANYFAPSPAHRDTTVYQLQNDVWTEIPTSSPVGMGEAYLIYCDGQSDYAGPVSLGLTEGTFLDYSDNLVEHTVSVQHLGTGARAVTVSPISSAPVPTIPPLPPNPSPDALAGPVPLEYLDYDSENAQGNRQIQFIDLPATVDFAATETAAKQLRIAVDRTEMAPYPGPLPAAYQTVLEVRDGIGFRRLLGVKSKGAVTSARKLISTKGVVSADPRAGLWVGTVVLDNVTEPFQGTDLVSSTPAEFVLRLIVHLSGKGEATLLRRVTQMWRDGTYRTVLDPEGNEVQEVDVPGRYVLVTPTAPPELMGELEPGSLRDGRPFARRISTAAYSLRDANGDPIDKEISLAGSFGDEGSTLFAAITLEADDPVNPFLHKYHPDHGANTRQVRRMMEVAFSSSPPDSFNLAGWGTTQIGGTYEETIEGIRRDPVKVTGKVRFQRASTVPVLNDGL